MRSKKAFYNIFASFFLQLTTIFAGLIIPRLIISNYGSDINGLVLSIKQFLSYIVLLEAGVGGVIRAALYGPLSKKDIHSISKIIVATENFFKKIASFSLGYILLLMVIYPFLVSKDFNIIFSGSLIIIIGISTFFQYYFGITYQILLQADQRQFITTYINIFTIIINTILTILLVNFGFTIHLVQFVSSLIFVIRPLFLNFYVKRKYNLVKNCEPDNEAIKQRWDGLGHHIAYLLQNNTAITVLTVFTNTKEVSVYSVYCLVISSVKQIITIFTTGLEAAFGNMIAKKEKEALDRNFRIFELVTFSLTTILFTCTILLILPFINLYTSGVHDISYHRPLFAYILITAEAIYCIRIPYNAVVLAAGHYKQTRNGAFLEAFLNVIISVILVNFLGIIGVAIGALISMVFRTIQYAIYLSKNILKRSIYHFLVKILLFTLTSLTILFTISLIPSMEIISYYSWFIYAVFVVLISSIITFLVDILFYYRDLRNLFSIIKRVFVSKHY